MPPQPVDQFTDMPFPRAGVDVSHPFEVQPDQSTPVGKNVRTFETLTQRGRGGSRPGLAKFIPQQLPAGKHLVQHLNYIVDPTTAALLDAIPDPTLDFPDPSNNPNPAQPRNPGRLVRRRGSGRATNRNTKRKSKQVQFVQAIVTGLSGGGTATFPLAVAANDLLLYFNLRSTSNPVTPPSDSLGNVYSLAATCTLAGNGNVAELWSTINGTAGVCTTIPGSSQNPLFATEYSGTNLATPIDGVATNGQLQLGATTYFTTTTTVPTNFPNEMVVGFFFYTTEGGSDLITTQTPESGFVGRAAGPVPASNGGMQLDLNNISGGAEPMVMLTVNPGFELISFGIGVSLRPAS